MPCHSVPVGAGQGSDTHQEGSTSAGYRIGSKRRWISERGSEMTGNLFRVLFIVVLIGVIVSVDLLFLRHHFATRLIVNIAIVVVFAIVYFISFKKSQAKRGRMRILPDVFIECHPIGRPNLMGNFSRDSRLLLYIGCECRSPVRGNLYPANF